MSPLGNSSGHMLACSKYSRASLGVISLNASRGILAAQGAGYSLRLLSLYISLIFCSCFRPNGFFSFDVGIRNLPRRFS